MSKKKQRKKSLKTITATAILTGSFLVPTSVSANVTDVEARGEDIPLRVKVVREAFRKNLADDQGREVKLSYAEGELGQWGNWGNWGNWNNWRNWNNWNNWGNWGNWGNL